ncbi:MAG TPA: hypothetical protein DCZ11_01815 [Gammaproteobacteria bacterium]|nr:hypothetical protein [Gammaproteobacteria bacterium]MCH77160.1 hypothetical protein [Gammaproteobacteria bacterium]
MSTETSAAERRESLSLVGVVTALAPISHLGSQRGGTVTTLNRQKYVQPDGTVEEVPIITGNSLRGQLRDAGMRAMLEAAGLKVDLPEFQLLFSGGMLTRADAGSGINVRVGDYRRLRELVPLLSVLGGAVSGQIMGGKLEVGQFIPICRETAHLLPPQAVEGGAVLPSVYDYLQVIEFTRRDDVKGEAYRELMAPQTVALLEEGDTARKRDVNEQAVQMRYGTEAFAAGTRFWHELHLRLATDLEREALWSALAAYAERSTLGGKSAIGLGRVRYDYRQVTLQAAIAGDAQAVSFAVGSRYLAHLREHRDEIAEILHRMAA